LRARDHASVPPLLLDVSLFALPLATPVASPDEQLGLEVESATADHNYTECSGRRTG